LTRLIGIIILVLGIISSIGAINVEDDGRAYSVFMVESTDDIGVA